MTMTMTTKGADNHNEEKPPQEGEIRKEGQGKEEGLASAKEERPVAVQVDNCNAVFLLMAEVSVATTTMLSSTIALGASSSLGVGTMTILLGLLLPH
jgi:hypothetical protein